MTNPLKQLHKLGQSPWLDYIERGMLNNGEFARFVEQDGVTGVTSNPAIFEKAIGNAQSYDEAISGLASRGLDVNAIYETLALEDVCNAADQLRPVYDATDGRDGFVSLEVSPHLAYDTEGTVQEARRFWELFNRPNAMIKVPATREGLPAIEELIATGINVNVTLLFSVTRYQEVMEAFIRGLERRFQAGHSLEKISSVASFFLSRIDSLVDAKLDADSELRGETAIVCAKSAYRHYQDVIQGKRWKQLEQAGAYSQRLLWASTSTKDPAYSDVKYVEALVGVDTVNTLPPETLDAYRDHGQPAARIQDDMDKAQDVTASLARQGIDLDKVSDQLEEEGVRKFIEPFDKLLETLTRRCEDLVA